MLKSQKKNILSISFMSFLCLLSFCIAGMNTHTEIYGTVSSFDEKNVVLVNDDGQFTIPRSVIPSHTKLDEGRQVRALVPTELVLKSYGQLTGQKKSR